MSRCPLVLLALLLPNVLAAPACAVPQEDLPAHRSDELNPLGWPAKGLSLLGEKAAGSGLWLAREAGRVFQALGDVLESPAMAAEAIFTDDRLSTAGGKLVGGTGRVVSSSLNLVTLLTPGGNVELGEMADEVNAALAFMERVSQDQWRLGESDDRIRIFPKGTRVEARGHGLEWFVPREEGAPAEEILQVAQGSLPFRAVLSFSADGKSFVAQERTWGFVVPDIDTWNARPMRTRVITTIHEFYHQYAQLHLAFRDWSLFYWPAYGVEFAKGGWFDHWAETRGRLGAQAVDRALWRWYP